MPSNLPLNQATAPVTVIPKRYVGEYEKTKKERIMIDASRREKLASFLHAKRANPSAPFGASDKFFKKDGYFGSLVPGLKHAHINDDISIVYRVDRNILYLYGFYKHDDLGTGQPSNKKRQLAMATRFSNASFSEDFSIKINNLQDPLDH